MRDLEEHLCRDCQARHDLSEPGGPDMSRFDQLVVELLGEDWDEVVVHRPRSYGHGDNVHEVGLIRGDSGMDSRVVTWVDGEVTHRTLDGLGYDDADDLDIQKLLDRVFRPESRQSEGADRFWYINCIRDGSRHVVGPMPREEAGCPDWCLLCEDELSGPLEFNSPREAQDYLDSVSEVPF